jgi:hypothetical protein
MAEPLDPTDPGPAGDTVPNIDDTGDRAWQLAALRGDIITDDAYSAIKAARALRDDGQLHRDPDALAALAQGDMVHADDPRRFERLEETWRVDIDEDPDTVAALEERLTDSNGNQPHEPQSFADRVEASLLTTTAIRALPPPAWLVEGYLVRDSMALLYGPSGTYKTFLGIDIALHVATGSWWHSKRTIDQPGRVIYVIAEGAHGAGTRIDAWQRHHRTNPDDHAPVAWLPRAVNLADRVEAAAFAEVAARIEPDLIVIDTLARCTLGAEENSARDMGLVVENLDGIRRRTGACVLAVHHTGKDTANGARGSSALRAAMDTEIEVGADPLELKVTKQKDAAEVPRLNLTPLPVEGTSSLVIVPSSIVAMGDEIGASDALVLGALVDIAIPGGVPSGAWEKAASVAPRTFYRARGRLLSTGRIRNVGSENRPLYLPANDTDEEAEPDAPE